MSGAEFAELAEHYKREPWGDYRIDLAGGVIASVVANANRDSRKKPEPFSPADFMPFSEKQKPNSAQQLRASLLHLVKKKVA